MPLPPAAPYGASGKKRGHGGGPREAEEEDAEQGGLRAQAAQGPTSFEPRRAVRGATEGLLRDLSAFAGTAIGEGGEGGGSCRGPASAPCLPPSAPPSAISNHQADDDGSLEILLLMPPQPLGCYPASRMLRLDVYVVRIIVNYIRTSKSASHIQAHRRDG